ncbi:hypothetical protein RND71_031394 [Anisodus tanguticus]|uniref:F-box domain-containing protein n=1 Tax=Anisodus tanguticus TaxID=243964 RepID=A0AAE1V4S4_9SOLA|nr:hypothetical protein RND71_031394 [Anisodus tanguticus]
MEWEDSYQRPKRTQHSQSSMHESILKCPTLPLEVVTEILVRLPVKSLLQFRCVSKSWLALISTPQFVKTHLNLSVSNKDNTHHMLMLHQDNNLKVCSIRSIFYENDESVDDVSDFYYPKKCPFEVVGSFKGLICLMNGPEKFLLWNPSIRKFREVTTFTDGPMCGGHHMYGFGYDELHDDYKIVRIFYAKKGGYCCDIYSFNSDSCRGIDDFQGEVLMDSDSGKLVSGKLHWVPAGGPFSCNDKDIVYIDLADEKWGKLEQPYYGEGKFRLNLGVLGSHLSMFCSYRLKGDDPGIFCSYQRTCTDVWVMKEYGVKESWARLHTIKFPLSISREPVLSPMFCKSNKGEILLEFGSRFMIYNPKHESISIFMKQYVFARPVILVVVLGVFDFNQIVLDLVSLLELCFNGEVPLDIGIVAGECASKA